MILCQEIFQELHKRSERETVHVDTVGWEADSHYKPVGELVCALRGFP